MDIVSSRTSAQARRSGIGTLTPCNAQKDKIASLLQRRGLCQSEIEVITFESSQGKEYYVVVVSLVRTMLSHTEGSVRLNLPQFYENNNAACVAFSRVREALALIAKCGTIAQMSSSWKSICRPYGKDQRKERKIIPISNHSIKGFRTQRAVSNVLLSISNLPRQILNRIVFTMAISCTELHRAAALRRLQPVDLPLRKGHSALHEATGCVKTPRLKRAGGLRPVKPSVARLGVQCCEKEIWP